MTARTKGRDRREMTFLEHLDELRTCLVRTLGWLVPGLVFGALLHKDVLLLLKEPYRKACEELQLEPELIVLEPTEGLMISLYAVLFAAILICLPLITWELWRFIEPALEDKEKRWVYLLLPASVGLFLGGVLFCYWFSPRALQFLVHWNERIGVTTTLRVGWYLRFLIRLMLSFGIVFQLPLVVMFLSMVGLVSARTLLSKWRHAIVLILILAAIITPTWDPVTFLLLAGPVTLLYLLSVAVALVVEKRRDRREEQEEREEQERRRLESGEERRHAPAEEQASTNTPAHPASEPAPAAETPTDAEDSHEDDLDVYPDEDYTEEWEE